MIRFIIYAVSSRGDAFLLITEKKNGKRTPAFSHRAATGIVFPEYECVRSFKTRENARKWIAEHEVEMDYGGKPRLIIREVNVKSL